MEGQIQFIQLTPDDLSNALAHEVKRRMEEFVTDKLKDKIEWLSTEQVAEVLQVSTKQLQGYLKTSFLDTVLIVQPKKGTKDQT